MKIDNQDIIRTAQQLRDEDNQQLHVNPWNRQHNHFHVPTWLVAIPAAAIIGFVLGLWTQHHSNDNAPLTALVDTVYIKVPEQQPKQDSVIQAIPVAQTPVVSKPIVKSAVRTSTNNSRQQTTVGRSVAEDQIRYDLLVMN